MRNVVIAGRYRLIELVGRGGMGQVWRARDEELQREVAVKQVVPPNWLAEHERDELRARTLREARTAARLNHPNVVRVYDVVRVQGDPWLIMEYVPSRSLQELIEADGPLPPGRAAGIGVAVHAALRAAHEAGVLHRDVKPANVLLARDGRVLLTDFGLAVFEGGDGAMTRPGLVLGSPQYVAPERAADGVSSVEADLWSLGATLHAAVEGRSPYARSTAMATLAALASQPPDPAPHAGPLMPVLVGLLRRDPRHRLGHDDVAGLLADAAGPAAAPARPAVDAPTVPNQPVRSGPRTAGVGGGAGAGRPAGVGSAVPPPSGSGIGVPPVARPAPPVPPLSGSSIGVPPVPRSDPAEPPASVAVGGAPPETGTVGGTRPASGTARAVAPGSGTRPSPPPGGGAGRAVPPPTSATGRAMPPSTSGEVRAAPAAGPGRPDPTDPDGADAADRPTVGYPDLMPPAAAARAWSRAALGSEWARPTDDEPEPSPDREHRSGDLDRPESDGWARDTPDRPVGGLGPTVLTSFVDPGSPTGPEGPAARADAASPVHTPGLGGAPTTIPPPVTSSGLTGSGALHDDRVRGAAPSRTPGGSGTASGGLSYDVPGRSGTGRAGSPDGPAGGDRHRTTTRRWLLAAGAAALAVLAGVGTALAVDGDHGHSPDGDDHAAPAGQPWERPPPPGGPGGPPPPPFPCIRPDVAGTPVQKGPPPADPAVTIPAGWVWPADTGGFHIALPAGWLQLRSGDTTCFQDPTTRRILGVEPYPGGDPVGRLLSAERDLTSAGRLPGYEKVRLDADGDGAEWECRWIAPSGERLHALRVLPGEEAGWTLGLTTSDADWAAAEDQFALIRDSIRPIRPTRTAG
ncbi:protein kinase [Micromonospora sp. NPDC018662]|uniref:serine/threonine-protein kinase n=1 Tax=Micromonospora sp. NPDC018662 TaxID=3364238 RepID=UPI003792F5BD